MLDLSCTDSVRAFRSRLMRKADLLSLGAPFSLDVVAKSNEGCDLPYDCPLAEEATSKTIHKRDYYLCQNMPYFMCRLTPRS